MTQIMRTTPSALSWPGQVTRTVERRQAPRYGAHLVTGILTDPAHCWCPCMQARVEPVLDQHHDSRTSRRPVIMSVGSARGPISSPERTPSGLVGAS